jgi:hypothetical protein
MGPCGDVWGGVTLHRQCLVFIITLLRYGRELSFLTCFGRLGMQTQFVAKNGFEVTRTWGLTVTVTDKPARISQERRLA